METIPEEIDQEIESALEIAMTDAGVGIEIFDPGEMTREIEIVCPEMVLLTQDESVKEKTVLNALLRRTRYRFLAR